MRKIYKKCSFILVLCFLLSVILPSIPISAKEKNEFPINHYYQLVNQKTGLVLTETTDDSYTPSTATYKIVVGRNETNSRQTWQFVSKGDQLYGFVSTKSGMAIHKTQESDMRIPGASPVVTVMNNTASPEQNWIVTTEEDGYIRLQSNYNTDQYLTATEFVSTSEENSFEVLACPMKDDGSQLWKLVEVDRPDPSIPDIEPIYPLDPIQPQSYQIEPLQTEVNPGDVTLNGYVGDAIQYVIDNQLKSTDWTRLVDQFRYHLDADMAFRGEFWGKLMRGACSNYKYTQDPELYDAIEYSVKDILSTQDEYGRISTYPVENELRAWDMWCRKYVMLGLESFYEICKDESLKQDLLKGLCIHADYILSKIGPRSEGKLPINESAGDWQGLPASSILEPMIVLYRLTGYQRYLDFSTYIIEEGGTTSTDIFQLAYENELYPYQYVKDNAKAYEMSSCFEGLAEYALITGNEKWKTAVENYCLKVLESEITVAGSGGGDGPTYNTHPVAGGEQWNNMAVEQTNPDNKHMQETCVTVTWFKLCRRVLFMTDNTKIADAIETTIYNSLLAAIKGSEADGVTGGAADYIWDYFNPLNGTHNNNGGGCIAGLNSCCPANGPSATGLIPFTQIMNSQSGPVVNLYIPGTVTAQTPNQQKVSLQTTTEYPKDGEIHIEVTLDQTENFTIRFRIPEWSSNTTVTINGEGISNVTPGCYLAITRDWKQGDTIDIKLDMRTRIIENQAGQKTEAGEYQALMRGPILLARDARFQDGSVLEGGMIKTDQDGYAVVTPSNVQTFPNHMEFVVETQSGAKYRITDYASAGSTWTEESQYASWLTTRKEITPPLESDKEYVIYCVDKNRTVTMDQDTGNAFLSDSISVEQASPEQTWILEQQNGYYRIKNLSSSEYLTVDPNAVGSEGGNILVQPYQETECQLWKLNLVQDQGYYMVVNLASNQLMSGAGDSNNIHQWNAIPNNLQFWNFVQKPVPPVQLDYTILQKVIEYAQKVQQTDEYQQAIPSVKESFDLALKNAESVITNALTQEEIDNAWKNLMQEIHKLGFQIGDKEALQRLYDQMVQVDLNIYQDGEAKDNFKSALENAKLVLDNQNAMQDEIDQAAKHLQMAFEALQKIADKGMLKQLLDECSNYHQEAYTPNTWNEFMPVYQAAQAVYHNQQVSQGIVDQTIDQLLNAMLQLRFQADKNLLYALVKEYEQIQPESYTTESFLVLQNALAASRIVLQNENIGADQQVVVDNMVQYLQMVKQNLIPFGHSEEFVIPTSLEQENSVKTGDAPIPIIALFATSICLGVILLNSRSRKN